jgi:hypothetical protein
MTPKALQFAAALAASGLLLSGCAETRDAGVRDAAPTAPISATLRTAGPGVTVNGEPAADGRAVASGDRVATAAGTSALVSFSDGTTVQLDEGSDEVALSWDGDQLSMAFDDTAAKVEKGEGFEVVNVVGKMASFFSWSRFSVEEAFPESFRVDLFEGNAKFVAPPEAADLSIGGGQYFLLEEGEKPVVGQLFKSEERRVCDRFERWGFPESEDCDEILVPYFAAPLLLAIPLIFLNGNGTTTTTTTTD